MPNVAALHGAVGLAQSRHHGASFSSASTSCTDDDFLVLTPARDSLEIVRKTIALKREQRRIAAEGDDLPVLTSEDLPARDSLEIAHMNIARKRQRSAVWSHHVPHRDSLDLARERAAARDAGNKRRSFKQGVCTGFRAKVGAALAKAKSGCPLDGSKVEEDTSVKGRPTIVILQHTVRKLA